MIVVTLGRKWEDRVVAGEAIKRSSYLLTEQSGCLAFLGLRDLLYGQQRTRVNYAIELVGGRIAFIDYMLEEFLVPTAPEVGVKPIARGIA